MDVKTFEVRDYGTFIPCIAIRLNPATEADRYLISRAGYGQDAETQGEYVIFGRLQAESEFQHDPFSWGDRTMQYAHSYVRTWFERLESGAVVDVQFLKGETEESKKSEREQYSIASEKMDRHGAVTEVLSSGEIFVQELESAS